MSTARLAAKVAGKREGIQSPEAFLEQLAAHGAAASTVRSYTSVFATFHPWFVEQYGQEPTPGAVTESVLRAWSTELARQGKAVATIRRHLSCLRSYLVAAGRPVPLVDAPTEVPRGPRALQSEEVARLVQAVERERRRGVRRATDARDEALLKLLVEAGLRLAEAVCLDRADLDGPNVAKAAKTANWNGLHVPVAGANTHQPHAGVRRMRRWRTFGALVRLKGG